MPLACNECKATVKDEAAMKHHEYNWHLKENPLRFPGGERITLCRLPDKDNMLRCPNKVCGKLFAARRTIHHHIANHCLYVLQGSRYQLASSHSQQPSTSAPECTPRSLKSKSRTPTQRPSSRPASTARQKRSSRDDLSSRTHSRTNMKAQPYPSTRPVGNSSTRAPRSESHDLINLAQVKQEGTMYEIEFKDVDDGVHWTNVGDEIMMMESIVPTVELYRVPERVKNGEEVWAKCRICRLGKFAVTSEGVSMDFELLPARKLLSKQGEQRRRTVPARVETGVVEALLDRSSAELARMVADKKMAEFQQVVRNLRDTLENLGRIECRFQGMQGDAVIVRELHPDAGTSIRI